MSWTIITDSSNDLRDIPQLPANIIYSMIPFLINVGEKEYIDNDELDIEEMVNDMETCTQASHTACPSPGQWYEHFKKADQAIAITISSRLSGSYNSAVAARNMILEEEPDKKIYILDSKSTGPALALYAEKIIELIYDHLHFDVLCKKLQEYADERHTIFGLCSFNNLIKNGRMSKFSGFVAEKLGIIGVGIAKEGEIAIKAKVRGINKMVAVILADMEEHHFTSGPVMISHCLNLAAAEKLKEKIAERWSDAHVRILPTGGLCSFYAERRGVIVTY